MKLKRILLLLASTATVLLISACTNEVTKPIFLPAESDTSSISDVVGAQCISSWLEMPRCTILNQGVLYYIQSTDSFVYCGSDYAFHEIDLTGPEGPAGEDGLGITWLGELPNEPATASVNDAYYDTTLRIARIYTASGWQILAQDGADGAAGADGIGIAWLGSFDTAPAFPDLNDAYYDTVLCKSFIYTASGWQILAQDGADGAQGPAGADGISIVWLGALSGYPASPALNNAFYHEGEGAAYIWDGDSWEVLCRDGESPEALPNEMTSFAFMAAANPGLSEDAYGVFSGTNITVTVPDGVSLSDLAASFAITGEHVTLGGNLQESGITENDFSTPKVYTVIAANGTGRNYVVTVTINGLPGDYCMDLDDDGYGTGSSCLGPDCNDTNSNINPGATEACNGTDDNCNGEVDEGFANVGDQCVVGTGMCMNIGFYVCSANGSGVVCSATAGEPSAETCNGFDDDCDGIIDEGCE